MRALALMRLAAVPLVMLASSAMAATAPSFPIKLAHENFSYAPESLPPGCQLVSSYTDKGVSGKVICGSKAEWVAGFIVGDDMKADCSEDGATPYVCHVHKNR